MLESERCILRSLELTKLAERQTAIAIMDVDGIFGDQSALISNFTWFADFYFDRHRVELLREGNASKIKLPKNNI